MSSSSSAKLVKFLLRKGGNVYDVSTTAAKIDALSATDASTVALNTVAVSATDVSTGDERDIAASATITRAKLTAASTKADGFARNTH